MTGDAFEHLVAERMIAEGFRRVTVRGGAGDGGVDITSGNLTRQARQEAISARRPLIVVERDRLADWLIGKVTLLPRRLTGPLIEGDELAG
ncbi:restriction endonuclease [Nonomuraea sp. CA-141351]|uniref:restriction endonuclease n=1 Tax=Nonomuraea sp. CA-141351 TaxID=3239996 RepID=UPI003D8D59B5